MKIKFIYKFIPIPVFYVESLGAFAGKSYGFFIRVVEEYKDDVGLLEHELQHCRQSYRSLFLHTFLYKFDRYYRFIAEIEAYAVQLGFVSNENRESNIVRFSKFITERYGTGVSFERAEYELRKKFNKN